MSTIYLCEQGSVVTKRNQRLQIIKEGQTLIDIPVIKIDKIFIFGNIQVTTQALALLLDHSIDVSYFTARGRLRGRLNSSMSKNIFLRLAQYERWRDPDYKINICRAIVASKLQNMKSVLQRFLSNYPEENFEKTFAVIDSGLEQLYEKNEISSVVGLEGASSGAYFSVFGRMFRQELQFTKRIKHPSPDPVNALLSLGYVMITNEIASLLEATAFDPFLGFMHGVKYGRKSLALDMVEQFRQPVIDLFTLRLANLKVFGEDDFHEIPEEGVHLTDEKFKIYLDLYEKRLNQKMSFNNSEDSNWRTVFHHQMQSLEKAILEGKEYQPYTAVL